MCKEGISMCVILCVILHACFDIRVWVTWKPHIACCKRSRHLYTTTAPSCYIPAPYCHLSVTLRTISITAVNLQDKRAVFRIFIARLRFSFDSTLYSLTPRCRVLLEQLTGLQLVKKFPAFHGTRSFITALWYPYAGWSTSASACIRIPHHPSRTTP